MIEFDFYAITADPELCWDQLLLNLDDRSVWKIVRITNLQEYESADPPKIILECRCINYDDECLFFLHQFGNDVVFLRDNLLENTSAVLMSHLDSLNIPYG